jgi:hypothetical protein
MKIYQVCIILFWFKFIASQPESSGFESSGEELADIVQLMSFETSTQIQLINTRNHDLDSTPVQFLSTRLEKFINLFKNDKDVNNIETKVALDEMLDNEPFNIFGQNDYLKLIFLKGYIVLYESEITKANIFYDEKMKVMRIFKVLRSITRYLAEKLASNGYSLSIIEQNILNVIVNPRQLGQDFYSPLHEKVILRFL